jgi:hypothetical protein
VLDHYSPHATLLTNDGFVRYQVVGSSSDEPTLVGDPDVLGLIWLPLHSVPQHECCTSLCNGVGLRGTTVPLYERQAPNLESRRKG